MDDEEIKLKLIDIPGNENFRSNIKDYLGRVDAIFVVYDITNLNSFNYIKNFDEIIKENRYSQVKKILIGNKCDSLNRIISKERGENYADENNYIFFETSALHKTNINEAIAYICKIAMKELDGQNIRSFKLRNIREYDNRHYYNYKCLLI